MLRASIILCAHNPRLYYLQRVLDALHRQGLPLNTWELLLVDNASNIALETILDISWHPNGHHIRENEIGLAYARQRGIDESRSELFVFLDDDTVLDDNYLAAALNIGEAWPELGVWGSGTVVPEYEIEPPFHLNQLLPGLAIRETNAAFWSSVPTCHSDRASPFGAGLCVRPDVAAAYSQSLRRSDIEISGRQGKSLLCNEDIELGIISCNMGLGRAVFPELRLTHLIPRERITEDYLLKVYEGYIISTHLLVYKWKSEIPRNAHPMLGLVANTLVVRGIERKMFFARRQARRKALEIIRLAQKSVPASERTMLGHS